MTALSSKRPKEVWRVIHRVLNPITNPLRADPDQLNKYLIGTNERTLGTTPDATSDLLELAKSLPEHSQRSFKLGHVTFEDVMKVIRSLRLDCSTGVDQIPVKFVKLVSEHIAGPLTRIIKTCITSSTFPRTCKTARVSPIPKTDHPQSEKGYRPVSILPAISKAFERLELKQLISYRDFFLLAPSISGFRKGHSTVTALLGIRDDLVRAMKRGEVSLMVFADYSKAFDTVCFKTVLTKMHALGFLNEFLTWMVHYLSDRRQLVQIDDKTSSIETVLFGVPQGPILGPFIFNLYVSDLQKHIKCPCYQYAEDTTFFVHSKTKDLANGVVELNDAISRLGDYSSESNFALNEAKAKWMFVSTCQMSRDHALHDYYPAVSCNGKLLKRAHHS